MTEIQTSQMKEGSVVGTFVPENPVVEQVLTPPAKKGRDKDIELDAVAKMICDRIGPHLKLELQRNGYHKITSIFSWSWTTTPQMSSAQSGSSPSKSNALELLTKEIETLLRQKLILEQERQGRFIGRLPW